MQGWKREKHREGKRSSKERSKPMVMKAGIWGEEKDFCNKLVSSDWFLNYVPGLILKNKK